MKQNQIRHLVLHALPRPRDSTALPNVNAFQVQMIERQLGKSGLTPQEQLAVIAQIKKKIAVSKP